MSHKGYSLAEKKQILNYVISQNGYNYVKGRKFWIDYVYSGETVRTWQSLKEVFLKRILPDLNNHYYKLSYENIQKIKKGVSGYDSLDWKKSKKPIRSSKTTIDQTKKEECNDSFRIFDTGPLMSSERASNDSPVLRKKSIKTPSKILSSTPDISETELLSPSKEIANKTQSKISMSPTTVISKSPGPSGEVIDKTQFKQLSATPVNVESDGERSVISDSQNNNQSNRNVKDTGKISEVPHDSQLTMTLLSSESEQSLHEIPQSSRKRETNKHINIREFLQFRESKEKSFKKMRESHTRPLLNSVVGKVNIRHNYSGSDNSRSKKYRSLALKCKVHSGNTMRHGTSTESICSSSNRDDSDDLSESDHKSRQPMYVINKGKVYPLFRNGSTKIKQCYYELCGSRKKLYPHKPFKSKHRRFDESLIAQSFCCSEIEKAYYKKFYKYFTGGKLGRKPRPNDYMNLETILMLKHEAKCKFANIADDDMDCEYDDDETPNTRYLRNESASKRKSTSLQLDFPNDEVELCYLRDFEKYCSNGNIGPKPIKENYQKVLTEDEKRRHKKYAHLYNKVIDNVSPKRSIYINDDDMPTTSEVRSKIIRTSTNTDTSMDTWRLKYLKEKKRSEELERLLQGECSIIEVDTPSVNKPLGEKPGPKCSKNLDIELITLSDDGVIEHVSPKKARNSRAVVFSDEVIIEEAPSGKCDLKVKLSKHGEDVLENAFNLNTEQADKLINLLSNANSLEKDVAEEPRKIDTPVPTNVSNNDHVETKIGNVSDIAEREKVIFEQIFANDNNEAEIDLKRQLFSSLELRMLLSDGKDDDLKSKTIPKTEEFVSGIHEKSTPEIETIKELTKKNKRDHVESNESLLEIKKKRSKDKFKNEKVKRYSERVEMLKSKNTKPDDDKKKEEKNKQKTKEDNEIGAESKIKDRKSISGQKNVEIEAEDKRTTRSNISKTVEEPLIISEENVEKQQEPVIVETYFSENVKFGFPKSSSPRSVIMTDANIKRSSLRKSTLSPKKRTSSQKRYFGCISNERQSIDMTQNDFNDDVSIHQSSSIIDTIDLDDTILIDQNKMIRFTSHLKTDSIENLIIEEALRFPNKIPSSAEINPKEVLDSSPETKAINIRELCPLTLTDMMSEDSS